MGYVNGVCGSNRDVTFNSDDFIHSAVGYVNGVCRSNRDVTFNSGDTIHSAVGYVNGIYRLGRDVTFKKVLKQHHTLLHLARNFTSE